MDLRQLRYFVSIAEHGNFHRAAKALNIAQSALSRHMQNLGEELGAPLFERTSSGTRTTALGKVFYNEAQAILERADSAIERSRKVLAGEIGRVVIGVNEIAARHPLIIKAIACNRRRYPEVELVIERINSPDQIESLTAGRLDLGVLIDRPPTPDFEWHPLFTDAFVVGMAKNHPLAQKSELEPSDLIGEKFVVLRPSRYGPAQAQIFNACQQLGFVPRVIQEAANEQMQIALIREGLGVGLVVRSTELITGEDMALRPLRGLSHSLDLDLLWRRDNPAKALHHLIEIFRELTEPSESHCP